MRRLQRAVTEPHLASKGRPFGRTGALLWWTFRDTASAPEALAKRALKAGFPPIFLPVPFPIPVKVAFGRALQRATAKVPAEIAGFWRADRVERPRGMGEPTQSWMEALKHLDQLQFGVLESWTSSGAPIEQQPWVVRVLIALNPLSCTLDVFAIPSDVDAGKMADRVKRMFAKELQHATAPEIGEGVVAALEDVRGVKLRTGLWWIPGKNGIALAEAVRKYLVGVGKSDAGMLGLHRASQSEAGRLIEMGLLEEVESLAAEIHSVDLKAIGSSALRTFWGKVHRLDEKLQTNEKVVGPTIENLKAKLNSLRRSLKGTAKSRKVTLDRTAGTTATRDLYAALGELHKSARNRDLNGLRRAEALLVRGQRAALAWGFASLLRRLSKLNQAAISIHKKSFFTALDHAVMDLKNRIEKIYPQP